MKQYVSMPKETRKLLRLSCSESYKVKRTSETNFEVTTKDLTLKASVFLLLGTSGAIIMSNRDDYNKIDVHKLKNYCSLLSKCHFGQEISI